ncbi:MAG: type II toxin-antitoxin system VapC family toxin, partial [Treponema sp.]|nr:type II toxin-antitoxin system VapC family toxin [Treponema sp.]
MGRYLLDTHTAMWFLNGDVKLSKNAKETILNLSNTKYLSIASAWEIAIKLSIGKLDIVKSTADFLHDAKENGFILIPISPASLTVLETLPMIHRDPFDRLLIATAITEQMTLITDDENIAKYEVSQIW